MLNLFADFQARRCKFIKKDLSQIDANVPFVTIMRSNNQYVVTPSINDTTNAAYAKISLLSSYLQDCVLPLTDRDRDLTGFINVCLVDLPPIHISNKHDDFVVFSRHLKWSPHQHVLFPLFQQISSTLMLHTDTTETSSKLAKMIVIASYDINKDDQDPGNRASMDLVNDFKNSGLNADIQVLLLNYDKENGASPFNFPSFDHPIRECFTLQLNTNMIFNYKHVCVTQSISTTLLPSLLKSNCNTYIWQPSMTHNNFMTSFLEDGVNINSANNIDEMIRKVNLLDTNPSFSSIIRFNASRMFDAHIKTICATEYLVRLFNNVTI